MYPSCEGSLTGAFLFCSWMFGADLRESDSFFENGMESDGERPREFSCSTSRQFSSGIFLDERQLTLVRSGACAA